MKVPTAPFTFGRGYSAKAGQGLRGELMSTTSVELEEPPVTKMWLEPCTRQLLLLLLLPLLEVPERCLFFSFFFSFFLFFFSSFLFLQTFNKFQA